MVLPVLLGLAVLLLMGVLTAGKRRARMFGLALAFPIALLTYGVLGVWIARATGVGHFYSVPFGAEQIQDWHILASVACWTAGWAFVILWLLRRRRGAA